MPGLDIYCRLWYTYITSAFDIHHLIYIYHLCFWYIHHLAMISVKTLGSNIYPHHLSLLPFESSPSIWPWYLLPALIYIWYIFDVYISDVWEFPYKSWIAYHQSSPNAWPWCLLLALIYIWYIFDWYKFDILIWCLRVLLMPGLNIYCLLWYIFDIYFIDIYLIYIFDVWEFR